MAMVRKVMFLVLIMAATVLGVTVASAVTGDAPNEVATDGAPAEGSKRIAARAENPRGGPPLGVLLYRNLEGKLCMAQGELKNGEVGATDARGNFRRYPYAIGGKCGFKTAPLAVAVERDVDPGEQDPGLTVWGVAASEVAEVTIAGDGFRETVVPQEDGAFIAAIAQDYRGALTVTATKRGGASETLRFPALRNVSELNEQLRKNAPRPHR